ncbi:hypothetical protein AC579_7527 [Pseudocercospora musae]|uniref:Uncharacterized protein n=1 Tax=Pseudocercospora musae TaxID=113226 RepID=A0A139I7U4_9PEZI|nr:hypothetical protein AC579_7527 [Pseudocercospora musae]
MKLTFTSTYTAQDVRPYTNASGKYAKVVQQHLSNFRAQDFRRLWKGGDRVVVGAASVGIESKEDAMTEDYRKEVVVVSILGHFSARTKDLMFVIIDVVCVLSLFKKSAWRIMGLFGTILPRSLELGKTSLAALCSIHLHSNHDSTSFCHSSHSDTSSYTATQSESGTPSGELNMSNSDSTSLSAQVNKLNLGNDTASLKSTKTGIETEPSELIAVVDDLLNQLSAKFSNVSADMLGKLDDMSKRLDALEAQIQAGNAAAAAGEDDK